MEFKLRKCKNCNKIISFINSKHSFPQYLKKKYCCEKCREEIKKSYEKIYYIENEKNKHKV